MCFVRTPRMPVMQTPTPPPPPPAPRSETVATRGAAKARQTGTRMASRRMGTRGMRSAGLQIYS
jgi:hypothetical protein